MVIIVNWFITVIFTDAATRPLMHSSKSVHVSFTGTKPLPHSYLGSNFDFTVIQNQDYF